MEWGVRAGVGFKRRLRERVDRWAYSPAGMRALYAWRLIAAPCEALRRRRAALGFHAAAASRLQVDRSRGYVRFGPGELEGTTEILALCRARLAELRPHLESRSDAAQGGRRISLELCSDDFLAREPGILAFALQDALLAAAIEYLGTVPVLARVAMALSLHLPDLERPEHHQRFHVDNDDTTQLELFLNVEDVAEEDGPLRVLPAGPSARVLRALRAERSARGRYATYRDEEVFRHADPSQIVSMSGPAGSGVLVDLSRCLHYGSRVGPGRERYVLGLRLLRYHHPHRNVASSIDPAAAGADALRSLALRPRWSIPPGTFFPDPLAASASPHREGVAKEGRARSGPGARTRERGRHGR